MLRSLDNSRNESNGDDKLYRAIVESQMELICRYLPNGKLTFVNTAFCKHFAQECGNLLEQNFFALVPEDRRPTLLENLAALKPENAVTTIEYPTRMPDGKKGWQHWTNQGIFNEGRKLIAIQSVGYNITDRKLAEIAAVRHARELSALHKATAALLSTLDLEALLGQILDAAISAIPAARKGMLHLIARDTGQLEMRAILGYAETDPRIQKFTLPSVKGYVAKAVSQRKPLLISDFKPGESLFENNGGAAKGNGVQSAIIAPLVLSDHVLGALSLESSTRSAFTENDLRLIVSFAATATAAIRNAQLHAEVQKQAITDSLLNIYNRRGFYELGHREIERAHRFERPLVAIMMDVDHFKRVNDDYGHTTGDQVLQAIAARLNNNIRKVDILGRYGGDEFSVLLPEIDLFGATNVAGRLRQSISDLPITVGADQITVTISLGVAKLSAEINDLNNLLQRADNAMYAAKQAGRNRIDFA
jgi:eukaryotic-like serine/threonine-protein kinase